MKRGTGLCRKIYDTEKRMRRKIINDYRLYYLNDLLGIKFVFFYDPV